MTEQVVYDKISIRKDGKPGKRYRDIILDGKPMREYEPKPGLQAPIYDPEAKKLVRAAKQAITSENAVAMQAAREDSRYALKVEGVKRALARQGKYVAKGITSANIADDEAITALADAITDHALDKNAPGSAHVKTLAANMLDMMPDKRGASVTDAAGNRAQAQSVEELTRLMDYLKAQRAQVSG